MTNSVYSSSFLAFMELSEILDRSSSHREAIRHLINRSHMTYIANIKYTYPNQGTHQSYLGNFKKIWIPGSNPGKSVSVGLSVSSPTLSALLTWYPLLSKPKMQFSSLLIQVENIYYVVTWEGQCTQFFTWIISCVYHHSLQGIIYQYYFHFTNEEREIQNRQVTW